MSEPDSVNKAPDEGVVEGPGNVGPYMSPRETRRRYVRSVLVIVSTGAALIAAGETLARLANTRAVEFPAAVLIGVGAATQAFLVIPELLTSRRLGVGAARSALIILLAPLWVLILFAVPARSPICLVGLLGVAALVLPLHLRRRVPSTEVPGEEDPDDRLADNGGVPHGEVPHERRPAWFARVSATVYTVVVAVALGALVGGLFSPTPVFDEMSNPDWSHDNEWISYTQGTVDLRCPATRLDRREDLSRSVVISRPDGSQRHRLADASYVYGGTWSPAEPVIGAWIATDSADPAEWATLRVEPNGRATPISPDAQGSWSVFGGPSWSPTGDHVAWVGLLTPEAVPQIVVTDPAGSRPVWIPVTDVRIGLQSSDHSWSADGRRLVYWAHDESTSQRGVWTVSSDGSDRRFIATTARGWATWSPGGSSIALATFARPPQETGLWLVNPDDGSRQFVSDFAGSDIISSPTWSPSGREIAVAVGTGPSFESPTYRILVFDTRDSRVRELVDLTAATTYDPCHSGWDAWLHMGGWSTDDRRILYAVKEGGRSGVYVIDTVTGRVTPVASRVRWVSRNRIETTDAPSWLSICAPRHNVESDLCR